MSSLIHIDPLLSPALRCHSTSVICSRPPLPGLLDLARVEQLLHRTHQLSSGGAQHAIDLLNPHTSALLRQKSQNILPHLLQIPTRASPSAAPGRLARPRRLACRNRRLGLWGPARSAAHRQCGARGSQSNRLHAGANPSDDGRKCIAKQGNDLHGELIRSCFELFLDVISIHGAHLSTSCLAMTSDKSTHRSQHSIFSISAASPPTSLAHNGVCDPSLHRNHVHVAPPLHRCRTSAPQHRIGRCRIACLRLGDSPPQRCFPVCHQPSIGARGWSSIRPSAAC